MHVLRPHRSLVVSPPDNHEILKRHADLALKEAGLYGLVPTRLEALIDARSLQLVPDLDEARTTFLKGLGTEARQTAASMLSKLRGILDTRERKVWVATKPDKKRLHRFPTAHEIAHDILPWHTWQSEYLDDSETLSRQVRMRLEREANFTAARLLYHGELFRTRALALKESLHSALSLADDHETTFHSAIWEYVEVQDRPVGVAVYRKSHIVDSGGDPVFGLREIYASDRFAKRFSKIELPMRISRGDDWVDSISRTTIGEGTCQLRCEGSTYAFSWESYSNHYCLFVLLRREPTLKGVGKVVRGGYSGRKTRKTVLLLT